MSKAAIIIQDSFDNKVMLASKLKECVERFALKTVATATTNASSLVKDIITVNKIDIVHDDASDRLKCRGKNNKLVALCDESDYCIFFYNGHPSKSKKTDVWNKKNYTRTGNALEEILNNKKIDTEKIVVYAYDKKVFQDIKAVDSFVELPLDIDMQQRNRLKSILLSYDDAVMLAKDILKAACEAKALEVAK